MIHGTPFLPRSLPFICIFLSLFGFLNLYCILLTRVYQLHWTSSRHDGHEGDDGFE